MLKANPVKPDEQSMQNAIGSFLRIGALVLILYYSMQILAPFVNLALWAIVLAVALHPMHEWLAARLGDRPKLSATIIVVLALFILLFPASIMTESGIESAKNLSGQLRSGEIDIPPPSDKVAEWPLVGEKVHSIWSGAAENLEETINRFRPQLINTGEWMLRAIGGVAGGILVFIASIIIAGFLMLSANSGYDVARKIMRQLLHDRGDALTDLSIATIRSVAKGVLGVAIIQTLLAAVGLLAANVPYAGILLVIILLVAVMQIPTMIIILPLIIWVYSVSDPVVATIFAVYMLLVGMSDNVLKPLLLGRGVEIPALVILLGAIGGMIYAGVIGLFLGAVVLALAYVLSLVWMNPDEAGEPGQAVTEQE